MNGPGFLRRIGYGISAGLFAGSLVGVGEAGWILTTTTPSEYQAICYGAILYGGIGGGLGLGLGAILGILAWVFDHSGPRAWCIVFFGVFSILNAQILQVILNEQLYLERGIPLSTTLALGFALGLVALFGSWIGGNILTKTPLKVLPSLKGTVVVWGGGIGLAWMFSWSPAPGGEGMLNLTPAQLTLTPSTRVQGPEFSNKPDVILIMIDSLRSDALGVYGAGPQASPAIDAFSKDAVVFQQFITTAAWSRSSVASLLSGRYPYSHGCVYKNSVFQQTLMTLAEHLSSNGYVTGGLPNSTEISPAWGFAQGFDWFPFRPQNPLWAAESSSYLSLYSMLRNSYLKAQTESNVDFYYKPASEQLEWANGFVSANQDKRFFLMVHLMDPHAPYFPHSWEGQAINPLQTPDPDPHQRSQLQQAYAGEVQYMDAALGAFMAQLKTMGRYQNSLIIVTANHGEEFLEHGGWWHGGTLYDEQVHVPLIIKLPNNARAGLQVPWQVRQIDIAPTIVEGVGFSPVTEWQGSTVFDDNFDQNLESGHWEPEVEEEMEVPPVPLDWANHPASRAALSEQDIGGYHLRSLRYHGGKLIQTLDVPTGVVPPRGDQFYDILQDRNEQRNIGGQGNSQQAELASQLQRLSEAVPVVLVPVP